MRSVARRICDRFKSRPRHLLAAHHGLHLGAGPYQQIGFALLKTKFGAAESIDTRPRQVCCQAACLLCGRGLQTPSFALHRASGIEAERPPPRNAQVKIGKRIGVVSQFMASSASPMKLLRARRPSRARSPRANISSDSRCSLIFAMTCLRPNRRPSTETLACPSTTSTSIAGALWARRKIDSLLRSEQGQRLRLG